MWPPPASGGAAFLENTVKVIRFARFGCTNRPIYHIVVQENFADQFEQVIEQLGSYDPFPNRNHEKLVALNYERISYWLGKGANVSKPVAELLGVSGFLPVYPRTYMNAWRRRVSLKEELEKLMNEKTDKNKVEAVN